MARHLLVALVLTVLAAEAAFADQRAAGAPGPQRQGGPGARPGGPRPAPRIDPLTAIIRGRVTRSDTGAPVRRAEVRAMGDAINRLVTTDADGRYELTNLPAGTFRVSVSGTGFVPLQYGQRRPFEAAVPIELGEGRVAIADVALMRGGAIVGRVYDEFGEPLAHVRVQALRSRVVEGRRRLQGTGAPDITDDTGAFRVYGLPPGDYYVSATGPAPRGEMGPLRPNIPLYFPGTANVADAQRITVGAGGEASAVFQMLPVQTARVTGIILDSSGAPAGDTMVNLRSTSIDVTAPGSPAGAMPLMVSGRSEANGTFELLNVPPGAYVLTSMKMTPSGPGENASVPIVVGGEDIAGIVVTTGTGGSLTGSFVREPGVTAPLPTRMDVDVWSPDGGSSMMMMAGGDGFRLAGLTGPVRVRVRDLPDGWAVKSIIVDGTDVTDSAIDLKGSHSAVARITLTNRVTEITGTVTSRAAPRSSVVIFADAPEKWAHPSRFVRTVRADAEGRFRVEGLPGGERYRAVAVDYLEEGEGADPEFLERMRERATSFPLGEAERKTLDLIELQR